MKQILTIFFLLAIAGSCITPNRMFAQNGDVLVVYATPNTLNAVINADTLANGARQHHVYQLVSLDTTYLFDGPITSNEDISVIGVVHPSTGRPPCIQPAVLQDNSIPVNMFVLSGAGTRCTFKNLYLLALATNNTANPDGIAMQVSADNVRLTVDNCVFDAWQAFAIGYNGDWDSFFVTRSHFRNMVHPNQWYIGEVLRNEWPGEKYTDIVSFKYNTMMCINGYASAPVTKFYTRYFEFIGNKVVFTFKNPFFIFNVTNGKINDNLFYANYAGGVDQTEHPWWDNLFVPDSTYGVIAFEPLSEANKEMFAPGNTGMAEALRTIEVRDNQYFWPTALTTFWTTYNSTATNPIRTPMWMNEPTIAMFADKATWPGLVESGNQSLDPGYGSAFDPVLNGTSGNDIGLKAWFTQVRTGTAASDVWGYQRTQVGAAINWVPTWPVPEVAIIGVTDVSPIDEAVPSAFRLYPVYPNPFNPSAKVRYTLDKSGPTNLKVYNILGQTVKTVLDHVFQVADTYTLSIDMSGFTSGVYFCVLEQSGNRSIQKMMLLK